MEHLRLFLVLPGLLGLFTGQVCEAQSSTINAVTLMLLPSDNLVTQTDVTLRCEAQISHSSVELLIHSFRFLRDGVIVYNKNSSDTTVDYKITPARASNSGWYNCVVRVLGKEKASPKKRLIVTGLQTPQLSVRPDIIYEGDEVTAKCSALEETGTFLFSFLDNDQLIKSEVSNSPSVEIRLKLEKLGEIYLHCNIFLLRSEGERSSNSNTVKVIIRELDIAPTIAFAPSARVIEGDSLSVQCIVTKSVPNLEVFLTKGNKVLRQGLTSFIHKFTARAEDSGMYICKTETEYVQKSTNGTVTVTELFSKPVLRQYPEKVFEGERFSLNCSSKVLGQREVTFSLYKGNVKQKNGAHFSAIAGPANNGKFFCKVEARGITKLSTPLELTARVQVSAPAISALGKVIIGKPFQLQCKSKSGSLPITFILIKDRRPVSSKVVQAHQALFNVSAISKRVDVTEFSCQAFNNVNSPRTASQRLWAEVVEPVNKPTLTVDPYGNMVVNEGSDVVLTCSITQGTPPLTISWYHSKRGELKTQTHVLDMQGSHTVKGIGQGDEGEYYCRVTNDANENKSPLITLNVRLALWKISLIVIFIFLLLVALAIVLLVLVRKSVCPCGKKKTTELSVRAKKSKSDDPQRVSLMLEEQPAPNATPGVMGRSVWSEPDADSGSDADSQEIREDPCENMNVTPPEQTDPNRGATDHVHAQGSLEYAQLNRSDAEAV
uniref:Ig-like domain-containing protein n=1 Tax=Denticeps clupeoides TaxID=299321 RepID=A0AAY4API7_9TELE